MKIAAFNIQKFGRNKVSDPDVLKILIKIVSRYDIVVILEVVDISGDSVITFLDALNTANSKHHYTLKISSRLGSYQFDDLVTEGGDVFARDPYILRFRCLNTVLKDLVMIPVHTKPDDSEKELDELYDVFLNVKKKWKTDNVMILGDFNADGLYVTKTEMKGIRIRSDKNFHWIVVYGDDMLQAVVPNSAKPFNFQKAYKLTVEQALKVSDHYPVEVRLKSINNTSEEEEDEEDGVFPLFPSTPPQDEGLLELQRGNLMLEREKLSLEIQILRMKVAKMNRGNEI
ncbi:Deoxyribonuclease gamma [Dissostichus eleginoides]|uniref:Deoxyribonuclease gamma n=1 Tax=Dissostichus eleginoides TaxID=100907 RepID=A0AAD9CH72_DISEL|nr:Deoxyribonuclease gamma [Dissostichus eleginoides]